MLFICIHFAQHVFDILELKYIFTMFSEIKCCINQVCISVKYFRNRYD